MTNEQARGGGLKVVLEQVQALQKDAKSEAEAVSDFLAFFQECVKKCPNLFIACENPQTELGMIELAASRADASFVSLAHSAAQLSGGGKAWKDAQRFVAMDVISFACGLLPQSVEHKVANAGRWAALKEYLIANGNKEPSYVDKVSLYPPGQVLSHPVLGFFSHAAKGGVFFNLRAATYILTILTMAGAVVARPRRDQHGLDVRQRPLPPRPALRFHLTPTINLAPYTLNPNPNPKPLTLNTQHSTHNTQHS